MNRLHLAGLVGLGAFGLLVPAASWGQAVNVDAGSIMRRLDAIEARVRTVEGKGGARPMAGGGDAPNAYTANDIENRLSEIEREVSQQAGTNDRLEHAIEQLAKRFDDYVKDTDLRMSDLEAKAAKAAAAPTPVAAPVAVAAPAATAAVAAGMPVATDADSTPAAVVAAASPTTKVAVPAKISATDLYNKAYAYLTATDYENARVWLDAFLKRYPGDKLADNAWYWLGEVQLVQNNPAGAVVSFRNGLKYFPKGAKAPANLYKMGVALEQLKQPDLARGAWEKLAKDYPKSPEAARGKEKMLGLKPAA